MTPVEEAELSDVTREEVERAADQLAQRSLGMTLQEFRAVLDRGGELPDHPIVAHLLLMVGASTGPE